MHFYKIKLLFEAIKKRKNQIITTFKTSIITE